MFGFNRMIFLFIVGFDLKMKFKVFCFVCSFVKIVLNVRYVGSTLTRKFYEPVIKPKTLRSPCKSINLIVTCWHVMAVQYLFMLYWSVTVFLKKFELLICAQAGVLNVVLFLSLNTRGCSRPTIYWSGRYLNICGQCSGMELTPVGFQIMINSIVLINLTVQTRNMNFVCLAV